MEKEIKTAKEAEEFDILIQAWLNSDNENTTHLAESLAKTVREKLRETWDAAVDHAQDRSAGTLPVFKSFEEYYQSLLKE